MIESSEILLDNFCKAVGDLVECYSGTQPEVAADIASADDHDYTAIIGLCDDGLSASIALTTNTETLRALSPLPLSNMADWLGELNNQLAGRFKNKLCVYGLQPKLSTRRRFLVSCCFWVRWQVKCMCFPSAGRKGVSRLSYR